MKILHICSEMYPLMKTGGLADVLGALPFSQQTQREDVRVLLPYYPQVAAQLGETVEVARRETFAGTAAIRFAYYQGLGIYVLDAPQCFARGGNPYHDEHYQDYPDNYRRFALLSYLGAQLAEGLDQWWGRADVLHAHDWQAGLACAYLHHWHSPVKSVFTIHNIAYVGRFAAHHLPELELPWQAFSMHGLEFYGELSYLKAGLFYADLITTVSPTYAREITESIAGAGFHQLLAERAAEGRLVGILNGVDENIWQPAHDPLIDKTYSAATLADKAVNKSALQKHFQLPQDKKTLLIGMVARLTEQKGADIVLDALPELLKEKVQMIVLGSGAPHLQERFQALAAQYPQHIGLHLGYDEALAHRIFAGSDMILVPSRFEPCGLTQLYALKYGALPLVRRTGGLADTVIDSDTGGTQATGFSFGEAHTADFLVVCRRALKLWQQQPQWQHLCRNAMAQVFTWTQAAQEYRQIYRRLIS